MIDVNLKKVEFDSYGSIKVPEVKVVGIGKPVNADRLRHYGELLRVAQNALDRIPTSKAHNLAPIETELGFGKPVDDCSVYEKELFETLQQLNAEVVLRVLTMRRLVTAGLTGR
jgi:hypothetical protein